MQAWELAVGALAGVAAVVEDLRSRRIPNWIPVATLAVGIAIHSAERGLAGLGSSLSGAVCGFLVFLVFYILGGLGGGDVKLMTGFGALLGPDRLWVAAWWTAILGAVLALAVLGWSRWRGENRKAIPYAPAIVAGVWIAIGMGGK